MSPSFSLLPGAKTHDRKEMPNSALDRFLASMQSDYEKWHDGVGYDLLAIDMMTPEERKIAIKTLLDKQPPTWRDLEALNHFNTDETRRALNDALKNPEIEVRVAAARYATNADDEREFALIDALEHADLYGGLTQALDQLEQFHPPGIVEALFHGTLNRDGEVAVLFAAMLFFLHGKASSSFDWSHRQFFLRFHTSSRTERLAVFKELCEIIGVNPNTYSVSNKQ
jgi:hypothetical protein